MNCLYHFPKHCIRFYLYQGIGSIPAEDTNLQTTVKRSVTLTVEDYEKLKRLASKKHCTVADVLREFIAEGFDHYALYDSSTAIKVAISQTLQDILSPLLEKANQKVTSVCWKAVRNSAAAMYLAEAQGFFKGSDRSI